MQKYQIKVCQELVRGLRDTVVSKTGEASARGAFSSHDNRPSGVHRRAWGSCVIWGSERQVFTSTVPPTVQENQSPNSREPLTRKQGAVKSETRIQTQGEIC